MSALGAFCSSPLGAFISSPLGARGCDQGCPETLEVTFSGVDAAICSNCRNIPSPLASVKINTLSFDGTYTVPFDAIDNLTGYCRFNKVLPAGTYGSYDEWTGSSFCPGSPTSNVTLTGGQITITLDLSTGEFDEVNAGLTSSFRNWNVYAASATGKTYGEAISNTLACAQSASDGGTATVATP